MRIVCFSAQGSTQYVTVELTPDVMLLLSASTAVICELPSNKNSTDKVAVPLARLVPFPFVSVGSNTIKPASGLVSPQSSVALTPFQLLSTALIITLKEWSATWTSGVPVLPEGVFGAAVSPGSKTCSCVNVRWMRR